MRQLLRHYFYVAVGNRIGHYMPNLLVDCLPELLLVDCLPEVATHIESRERNVNLLSW